MEASPRSFDYPLKVLHTLLRPDAVLATKAPAATPVRGIAQSLEGVKPGFLFFAIKGSKADGHVYAAEALTRGASAVVVEDRSVYDASDKTILVDSTRERLGEAVSRWFEEPSRSFELVGVTGTNGKTTSTFLLDEVWRAAGKKTGLIGTVEYRVGKLQYPAPLTTPDAPTLQELFAQMRDQEITHVAMEVSSIALHQSRVAGSYFEAALFTNLTPDHLDYHGSMENYQLAKQRLFRDYAPAISVFNWDDGATRALRAAAKSRVVFTFSTHSRDADFSADSIVLSPQGIRAIVHTPFGTKNFDTGLMGLHNLSNCLGVLGVEMAMGAKLDETLERLRLAVGAPGRLERVAAGGGRPAIFVDYAHTEDALRNVLASLRKVQTQGKILTVFGCGGDRDRGKRPKMAAVAAELSDFTIATSDNPRTEDPEKILDEVQTGFSAGAAWLREVDRRKAIGIVLERARPDDIVLIAGKGHETYQILGSTKVPFDDREVIRDYYGV